MGTELKEIEKEQGQAKDYLEGLAAWLRTKGLKVKTVVWEGDIKESILAYIEKSKATVVVLTTHGAGGMDEERLLGGVAQFVMKESPAPVLLLKPVGKPPEEI